MLLGFLKPRGLRALLPAFPCAFALATVALLIGAGALWAQGDPDPTGHWLAQDENAVIAIEYCDEGICGTIYWMEEGPDVRDEENRDESLRDRPLCGITLLSGFEQNSDDPGEWEDGEIYAPDDGRTYSARVRVQGPDELELRGYRGFALLGRSQTWTRVDPDDYPACDDSPAA